MNEFDQIEKIAGSELVQISSAFEKEWGKKFRLGHTDWVIRHDMLQEGHGHIDPAGASAYFQSIRELFVRASSIEERRATAMEAQADALEAKEKLKESKTDAEKLRAKAKLLRAKNLLKGQLLGIKDLEKEMNCLYQIMKELEPQIKHLYDCDIEKAQPAIWEAKYKYALLSGDRLDNKALPLRRKAELSHHSKNNEGKIAYLINSGQDSVSKSMLVEMKKQLEQFKKNEAKQNNNPLPSDEKRADGPS